MRDRDSKHSIIRNEKHRVSLDLELSKRNPRIGGILSSWFLPHYMRDSLRSLRTFVFFWIMPPVVSCCCGSFVLPFLIFFTWNPIRLRYLQKYSKSSIVHDCIAVCQPNRLCVVIHSKNVTQQPVSTRSESQKWYFRKQNSPGPCWACANSWDCLHCISCQRILLAQNATLQNAGNRLFSRSTAWSDQKKFNKHVYQSMRTQMHRPANATLISIRSFKRREESGRWKPLTVTTRKDY
jgi:hypothetical protein